MLQSMRGGGEGRGKGRLLVNKYSCCFNVEPCSLGEGELLARNRYCVWAWVLRRSEEACPCLHIVSIHMFPFRCTCTYCGHCYTPPLSNWLSVLCALQEWLFLYFSLPSPHSLHESLTPPLPVLSFNICTSPSLPLPSLPAHGHYPPDLSDKIAPPSGQPTQCIRLKNMFETIK